MNYLLSILFRAIPLAMALICFFYGGYIFLDNYDPARYTAGPVIFFLGSICLALYATAATIIRQIIKTYNSKVKYILPVAAYIVALITFVFGIVLFSNRTVPDYFVAGHVICGLGLITFCVATAATASTRFRLINQNSALPRPAKGERPKIHPEGFSAMEEMFMVGFACFVAVLAWSWTFILLSEAQLPGHFVAGSVMGGIACVCSSLIALVASIARQVRGNYMWNEKRTWPLLVFIMGSIALIWGLLTLLFKAGDPVGFVGYVQIGLGLICLSISSKVVLLAKIWRSDFPLAARIPIIPVLTALTCLFLAGFLFEASLVHPKFMVPARVLMGFGAICFTLYSIVSILETGTRKA